MKRKLKGKDVPKQKGIQSNVRKLFWLAWTEMSNTVFLMLLGLGPPAVSDSGICKSVGCKKNKQTF